MIKNGKKLSELFYNNKFLLIFSVVAAVIIWIVVAVEFSPETEITIRNVPVRVASTGVANSMKLEPFGAENLTVDVTVVGKRYIVEDDSVVKDIDAVANTASVTKAGTHKLSIDVGSISTRPQYEIVSYSVSEVEVLFDYYVEKQVPVNPVISIENGEFAAEGYFAEEFNPEVEKVTIYGPKSEVEAVMRVDAYATVAGNLVENNGFNASMKLAKLNGDTPRYVGIKSSKNDMSSGNIYINTVIYKEAVAESAVTFTDLPAGLENADNLIKYTVEPASAVFGFSDAVSEKVSVATISFNDLDFGSAAEQEFVVEYSANQGISVKDEETGKAGTQTFTIKVSLREINYSSIALPAQPESLSVKDINNKHHLKYEIVSLGDSQSISVCGFGDKVFSLTTSDLQLDFSAVPADASGEIEVPVVLDADYCWIESDYSLKVKIIK